MSQTRPQDRSVVVTGLGLISPLGTGTEETWSAALAGKSGVVKIDAFDASIFPTQIAGQVRDFEPTKFMDAKEVRRNDRFIQLAVSAADMALKDSGMNLDAEDRDRIGVVIGSGMGGLHTIEEGVHTLRDRGWRKVTPFFVPSCVINLAAGQVSLRWGLKGPNFAPVSACATSNHALGEAMLLIERGMADVIVAGGAEATITPSGLAGFCAARAMSERNDAPQKASRPFDKGRDGFVAAEGAGVLVLETYAHAKARGARILAWLAGYGASADAHHVTSPPPDGSGALRAMKMALSTGGIGPDDVGHVNAHATSTPVGDVAECRALSSLLGDRVSRVPITATKSLTGHMLGAAGAVEAGMSILALDRGVIHPTLNVDDFDPDCGAVDVVRGAPREVKLDAVLSNGFGFGGTNASILFRRV